MDKKYPDNTCVCETDDQWAGRNLLREAFMKSAGGSYAYKREGLSAPGTPRVVTLIDHDIPLHWFIDTPETHRRQYFSQETAEKAARPIRAFLEANGIEISDQPERLSLDNKWTSPPDLVRVYTNAGHFDPHASDPATVAMLPHMQRNLWNLVRHHDDEYKF